MDSMTAMKRDRDKWTEQDFDDLGWHDCHVHAIRFHNPDEGYDFDLVLDIDQILEWIEVQGGFNFVVAPALLTFSNVNELVIGLELACKENLAIDRIEREEISAEPYREFRWTIHFHSLAGHKNTMRFRSNGFVLALTKQPRTIECQGLEDHER
jgi:hypothetical protein